MKSIKIGKLVFNKKAIRSIILALFLNGCAIGASVASQQISGNSVSPILIMLFIFMPHILLWNSISKNVEEVK